MKSKEYKEWTARESLRVFFVLCQGVNFHFIAFADV